MATGPLVSVVMSVFNAERFLEEAIGSILDQTYKSFEFIVVDDGSKDRTWDIALRFGQQDTRIRVVRLEKNQGVSVACNTALNIATGKYIARMDSDDISLPHRLLRQVEFMEAHPEVGVLGCGMRYMDETGKLLGTPPIFHGALRIRWNLLFESPFFNPTVILRKAILDQYDLQYDLSSIHGEEDYELWSRLLPMTKGENLSDILLYYRLHPSSISHRYVNLQHDHVINISARVVKACLPDAAVSGQEVVDLQKAFKGERSIEKRQRARLILVYFKIWDEFRRVHAGESGLDELEQSVIAWATRMIFYPLFQPYFFRAFWFLTKKEWRWPIFLLKHISYYWARRRIE
jgi:glycosyltransferase involved in cell wall biosynthesis